MVETGQGVRSLQRAYFDDDNGSKSGSVYIYKNNGEEFIFQKKILASDGSAGDAFGASLDIDGPNLVVGAYADSENGFFSGSAYIFHLPLLLSQKVFIKECESFNIWTDYTGRKIFVNKALQKHTKNENFK